MKKLIRTIFAPVIELKRLMTLLIIFWPDSVFGSLLRIFYYKNYERLKKIGKNTTIESGVRFGQPDTIEIGDNCIFGRNVNINSGLSFGVYIGNFVAIADGTYLRSENHRFDKLDIPIQHQGHDSNEIEFNNNSYSVVIEDDVWIGARVILLSGAHIGEGSVISAGSVVSNKIPPYSIAVGNPARVVANRKMLKK
jgi:maltose O-acetyltransferase